MVYLFQFFCLLLKIGLLSCQYYVGDRTYSSSGDGSLANPFNNLIKAVSSIQYDADKNYTFVILSSFLTIVDDDISQNSVNLTVFDNNRYYLFYKNNTPLNISIMPNSCYENLISKKITECEEKVIISIKTERIFFYVGKNFNIFNIIFSGIDLPLVYSVSTDSECYFSKECCNYSSSYLDNLLNNRCFLNKNLIKRTSANFYNYSFFLMDNNNSLLGLYNCKFQNFYAINITKSYGSLFSMNKYGSSNNSFFLDFQNIVFDNCYFLNGLISGIYFQIVISDIFINNYNNASVIEYESKKKQMNYINKLQNSIINLKNCLCQYSFGVFYISSSLVNISNASFSFIYDSEPSLVGNYAFLFLDLSRAYLENITFYNNSLQYYKSIIKNFFYIANNNSFYVKNLEFHNATLNNHNFLTANKYNILNIEQFKFFNTSGNPSSMSLCFFLMESNNFTLIGSQIYIMNFSGNGGMMYLQSNNNVNVTYLIIDNYYFLDENKILGGGIYSDNGNKLLINNSYVNNIVLSTAQGGVIYLNTHNNLTIVNSTFIGITGNSIQGGVIFSYYLNDIEINMSDFIKINSSYYGGVFYISSLNNFQMSFVFFNGSLAESGGIIFAEKSSVFILNEVLTNNTVVTNMAAIFLFGNVQLSLNNSIFLNSIAYQKVGAIYFSENSEITLFNNIYLQNITSVAGSGGSFYFENSIWVNFTYIFINGSQCVNDFQPGGGFYLISNNSLSCINCIFVETKTNDHGGVAFIGNDNKIYFQNCVFFDIYAANQGGAFYLNQNNTFSIILCDFFLSKASSGGTFFANYLNVIEINSINIVNTEALYGAVFYCELKSNVTISNMILKFGYATKSGGNFYLSEENILQINNSVFKDSFADGSGGSFYLDKMNNAYLQNITFTNNSAKISGGVFEIFMANTLFLTDVATSQIYLNKEGGLFDIYSSNSLTIKNLNYSDFLSSAGGLLQVFQQNNISLFDSIIKNGVSFNGASVFLSYSSNKIMVNNSKFIDIFSYSYAGLLLIDYQNNFLFNNSEFLRINAINGGGAFFLSNDNWFWSENCIFQDIATKKLSGGLISARFSNNMTFINIIVEKCSSEDSAGVFLIKTFNKLAISFSNFSNISTGFFGGSLISANVNNKISIESIFVINSTAISSGGIFYLQSSNTFNLSNSNFNIFGVTKDHGGGFFCDEQNHLTVHNTSFTNISFSNGYYGIFLYFSSNNSGLFVNNSLDISYARFETEIMMFLLTENSMILEKMKTSLSFCFCLFFLADNNYLSMGETAFGSMSETSILFYSENSEILIEKSAFKIKIIYSFLLAFSSKVTMNKFFINSFIDKSHYNSEIPSSFPYLFSDTILFNMNASTLILKKGTIHLINTSDISTFSLQGGVFKMKQCFFMGLATVSSIKNIIELIDLELLLIKESFFLNHYDFKKNGSAFNINFKKSMVNGSLQSFKFSKNIFLFNKAKFYGGCIYISNLNNNNINGTISFSMEKFFGNKAKYGAVISFINATKIMIEKSNFTKNTAYSSDEIHYSSYFASEGGALYYENLLNSSNSFLMSNNIFEKNAADIGGSIFHAGAINITENDNLFINNSIKFYGDIFASEIKNFYFVSDLYQDEIDFKITSIVLKNVTSGKFYSDCLMYLAGIDAYSQLAFMSNSNKIPDLAVNSIDIISLNYTKLYGFYCLSGPYVRNFSDPSAKNYHYELNSINNSSLSLEINYRDCIPGEKLADNFSCIECLRGEYLLEFDIKNPISYCNICGENLAFYCFGGNKLTPRPGYWRKNSLSDNFLKCQGTNCMGDPRDFNNLSTVYEEKYASGLCTPGYTGVLCSECEEGRGKLGNNVCDSCERFNYFGLIIFFTLIKILFSIACIHFIFKMGLDLFSPELNFDRKNIGLAIMLKIWNNHIEILSTLLLFPANWSDSVKTGLRYILISSFRIGDNLPLECLKRAIGSSLKVMYFKLVITIISPFIIVFVNFFYVLIFAKYLSFKKNWKYEYFEKSLSTPEKYLNIFFMILWAILLYSYTEIMKVCFEMIQYINIGGSKNAEYVLVTDTTIVFSSDDYYYWFLRLDLPTLIIYGMLFPITIFSYLFWQYKSKRLYFEFILCKFSIFFYGYKDKYVFWEIIVMVRKAILVFIQLYSFSSSGYKDLYPIILMMGVLLFATGLQKYFCPFKSDLHILNHVEFSSLISLTIIFYLGIFYSVSSINNTSQPYYYDYIFIILVIFANLIFLFTLLYYMYKICKKRKLYVKSQTNLINSHQTDTNEEKKPSLLSLQPCKDEITISNRTDTNSRSLLHPKNISLEKKNDLNDNLMEESKFSTERRKKILTTIQEQFTQEKIFKTSNELEIKKKQLLKTLNRQLLKKKIGSLTMKTNYKELIAENKICFLELKGEEISDIMVPLVENVENNKIFSFYEKIDGNENARFNSFYYNHIFLEENENFYQACFFNNKIFINSKDFKMKSSFSLEGDNDHFNYLRLTLTFISELIIDEFDFELKKHEDIISIFDPSIKNTENFKEKTIDIFFILNGFSFVNAPEATISCKLGKGKYTTIYFKLPLLMNRFLELENISEMSPYEYHLMLENNEYYEKTIENIKKNYIHDFKELREMFPNCLYLENNTIATKTLLLNKREMFLNITIHFQEEGEKINLVCRFGIDNRFNDYEKSNLHELAHNLAEIFQNFFNDHHYEIEVKKM